MRAALLCGLLLAGCGGGSDMPADCQKIADADPEVRELEDRAATNIRLYADTREPLRKARDRAASGCLRDHGLLPPGGVERRER